MPSPPVVPRHLSWLVAAVVLVSQLVMVRDVAGPLVYADELGYIAAARYFAPGVPDVQMLSSFYHFGYGLLLAPLVVVFDEPASFYRAATFFNVGLGVGATWMFHHTLLRWSHSESPRAAALAALGFGLAPSILANTSIVWAETALVAVLVLLIAVLQRLFERPTLVIAVGLGLLAAFAYGVHPRAIALTLSVVVVVSLGTVTGRLQPFVGLVGLGSIAIGVVVVTWTNRQLRAALYTEGSIDQSGTGLFSSIVDHPGQWLAGLGGSLWYQVLASAGLAGVGVWHVSTRLVDKRGAEPSSGLVDRIEPLPLFLLLSLGISWGVGAVIAVADDPRIDQFFYGRYLDLFAPLLIGFGVFELSRRTTKRLEVTAAVGGLVALVGGLLLSLRANSNFFVDAAVVPVNVPVVTALQHIVNTWNPQTTGMLGALWCVLVMLGFRWKPAAGTLVLVVGSILLTELMLSRTIRPASHAGEARAGLAAPVEELARGGVVFVAAPYEFWTLNGLQFWADDAQFALESHCPTSAVDVVVAPADDARFSDWAIMATDLELGRQVLLDTTSASATSRSIDIDIVEATVLDGLVTTVVDITNLDSTRSLELGGSLLLHARFAVGGSDVGTTAVDLVAVADQDPLISTRHTLEFRAPASARDTAVQLRFDVRDGDRGWLSASPCQQAQFDDLSLDID